MYTMPINEKEQKKMMIRDIVKYSDFYHSYDKLESEDFSYIKNIYYACLIPIFKGFSKSKGNQSHSS